MGNKFKHYRKVINIFIGECFKCTKLNDLYFLKTVIICHIKHESWMNHTQFLTFVRYLFKM